MSDSDHEQAERQAERDQIRATLLDADLSDVWLRCKVQQLLDQADELAAQLAEAQEGLGAQDTLLKMLREQLAEARERERIEEVNAQAWKTRVEDAEVQLAERERALQAIIGFAQEIQRSTAPGDAHECAKHIERLAATHSDDGVSDRLPESGRDGEPD